MLNFFFLLHQDADLARQMKEVLEREHTDNSIPHASFHSLSKIRFIIHVLGTTVTQLTKTPGAL